MLYIRLKVNCRYSGAYVQPLRWGTPRAILSHRMFLNSRFFCNVRFRWFLSYEYTISFLSDGKSFFPHFLKISIGCHRSPTLSLLISIRVLLLGLNNNKYGSEYMSVTMHTMCHTARNEDMPNKQWSLLTRIIANVHLVRNVDDDEDTREESDTHWSLAGRFRMIQIHWNVSRFPLKILHSFLSPDLNQRLGFVAD